MGGLHLIRTYCCVKNVLFSLVDLMVSKRFSVEGVEYQLPAFLTTARVRSSE
jgi:hypothetical protein